MNRRNFLGVTGAAGLLAHERPRGARTPEAVSDRKPNVNNVSELGVTFTGALSGFSLCLPAPRLAGERAVYTEVCCGA